MKNTEQSANQSTWFFFSFGNVFKTMQVRSICIPPICQLLLKVIHIYLFFLELTNWIHKKK